MQNSNYSFIAPSSTCLSEDLLFFDTFSHSNSDKDNFDLVQFPSPVVIDLIKIIPLGQPVEAKIPGNVRLGATNPSNCELEFFINDLTKQDAHTMTDLGKFQCSEKETEFSPPLQIQTDGLLLRGSYRTLTLAIFGQIAAYDEKQDEDQVITSAASPPAQTPASPVASEHDIPYIVRSVDQELLRTTADEVEDEESLGVEHSPIKSTELHKDGSSNDNVDINEDGISEVVVANQSSDNIEELSNSEEVPQPAFIVNEKHDEEIEYSNSNSDLDDNSRHSIKDEYRQHNEVTIEQSIEAEKQQQQEQNDDHLADYDAKEWYFNLDTYSPKPLVYFPDPSLTLQEKTLLAHQVKSGQPMIDKEVEKVKEMFDVLSSDNSKTEEWVTLVEDLTNDISNMTLNQTVCDADMLKFLVEQVLCGLDLSMALQQRQTGFKVRHLRAGIKLATILFHCGDLAVSVLLQADVVQKVLSLYSQDQMSLPLRLLIFKCLSAACDTVQGAQHLINQEYSWDNSQLLDIINKKFLDPNNPEDMKYLETIREKPCTCYQFMLLILMSQPTTRVTIAIGNLVKKIRFYQNLSQLAEYSFPERDLNESEDSVFEDDKHLAQLKRERLEKILLVVQDLVSLMKNGCNDIVQPIRHLPAKTQFHVKPNSSDNYTAIYKWFKHFRTIECLNMILITTRTKNLEMEQSVKLQGYCLAFIQQIITAPRSTQLLLSKDCVESTTNLVRTLSEKVEQTRLSSHLRMSRFESLPDATFYREETLLAASCRDLSLKLCYNFKVFSCIDKLFEFHRELIAKRSESSPTDPEKILHQLYIMSDHPYGLAAIMKHFSCIGNLDCILRFLDMPEYHKHLEFVRETSIDYVLELVGTFLRLNNNVIEIAEEYLDTLLELCKTKNKNLSVRIKSLLPWLNPFDLTQPFPLITYTEETFRHLTRVIRRSIPDCSIPFAQGLNFELPPQLITAVRILRQLCIPPQVETFIDSTFDFFSAQRLVIPNCTKTSTFMPFVDSLPHQQNHNQSWNLYPQMSQTNLDDTISDQLNQLSNLTKLFQPYEESICDDLKYHYAIVQVFEQEGLKRLLNTLRELVGNYSRPIYQSAALSGLRGRIVLSYINSVAVLLQSITCHLIDARGKEFKDTSIIPVVLETYSLLCFVPKPNSDRIAELMKKDDLSALQKSITLRSDNYQLAQQAKKLILSILLSYTQMCLSVSESEKNVISKSMWTKMLQEVVDFTLSTPVFFHHGLDVLTKILPAPLPCTSMSDTTDQEQLFKNINHRKLWSAHLHPLHQKIEQMISSLSLCCQSNIRTLLCYLCNQLCDLSSNAACMVAKIVTDTLLSCPNRLLLDGNPMESHNHQQSSDQNQTHVVNSNQQSQQQLTRRLEDTTGAYSMLNDSKESKFAVKIILNLLSNLITNQAFEIAFTNHLQSLSKKDEKLLTNLQTIVKVHNDESSRTTNESSDGSNITQTNSNGNPSTITGLIESIKYITESSASKDNLANILPITEINPPENLTKINLVELARKTSDRFNLTTGTIKTYRLKVLLDLNSRAPGSTEQTTTTAPTASNVSSASSKRFDRSLAPYSNFANDPALMGGHKQFGAPPAMPGASVGRGRNGGRNSGSRSDSFRSRPQNTSRPPSIHVDDFVDIYRESSTPGAGSSGRYSGGGSKASDYRNHSARNGPPSMDLHRHSSFFGSQGQMAGHQQGQLPPPPPPGYGSGGGGGGGSGGGGGGGGGGRRSHHGKGKYMKMKSNQHN